MRTKPQPEENPLPRDKDGEISILGAIIRDAANYRKASRLVSAGDFYFEEHRIAFQGLSHLASESKATDDASLIAHLADAGLLEKAGSAAYVAQHADGVHSMFDVTIPARRVHELSVLRQIATRANHTVEAALSPGASARDVLTSGITSLRELTQQVGANAFTTPGSGAEILEAVERFIRRFVVMTADQSAILALWVAHTHAFPCATATPYININSSEKQSGKTRALETLELVTARPWSTGRTSAAALVRKIADESPTLLLDESDAAFAGDQEYSETLRGILNTGHRIGGASSLVVGKGAEMTVRDFNTFCPKTIAGLGKLPDTVADRSIPIILKRAMSGEIPERFRRRNVEAEASELRDRLAQWTASIFDTLDKAEPFLPESLTDRQQDGAEPLLAIADAAGGDWPFKARNALVAIFDGSDHAESIRTRLLGDIRSVFDAKGADRLSSEELTECLAGIETSPWSEWSRGKPLSKAKLARLLHPFGIVPHSVRIGDSTPKGYERDDFRDSWNRYPCSPLPRNSATTQLANTGAGSSDFMKRNEDGLLHFEKAQIANTGAACCVVALSTQGGERESAFDGVGIT